MLHTDSYLLFAVHIWLCLRELRSLEHSQGSFSDPASSQEGSEDQRSEWQVLDRRETGVLLVTAFIRFYALPRQQTQVALIALIALITL